MTLAAGSRLGAYEILAPIASGGMGEVFRARQPRLDRLVAIKVLRGAARSNPEIQQRFRREIELLSRLSHPHLIRLYDGGHEGEQPYLVMELVEGSTLGARAGTGPTPLPDFLRIATPVTEAIEYLHEHGILHRDLKPTNVLVDGEGRPRVSDFGLARSADATIVTEADQVLGTPAYMPPEVLEGREWSAAGDIYSLGVIFYELLTDELPYDETGEPMLYLSKVQSGHVIPLTSRRRSGSPEIDRMVEAMLARDPARRPSAGEVVKILLEADHLLDEDSRGDFTTVVWKPVREAPFTMKVVGAAFVLPMLFALGARLALAPAAPATHPASVAAASASTAAPSPPATPAPDHRTWLRHLAAVIDWTGKIDRRNVSNAWSSALEGEKQIADWATMRKSSIREVRALIQAADEAGLVGPAWAIVAFECHRLLEHLNRRNQYNGLGDPAEGTALLSDLEAGASADPHRRCFAKMMGAFCEKSRVTVDEARRQAYLDCVDILDFELARPGNEIADRFLLFLCLRELRDKPGVDDALRRMLQDNPVRDGYLDAIARRYLGLAVETLPRLLEYEPVPGGFLAWDSIVIVVADEAGNILEDYAHDRTTDSADIVRDTLRVLDGCFYYADRMAGRLEELRTELSPLAREIAARTGFELRHLKADAPGG